MEFIDPKKIFGLGTGSTVNLLINKIHKTFILNGQSITAVSTSKETTDLATKLGIKIIDLDQVNELDVVIDGADEVDPNNNLIKGGGGALLMEKIVANYSKQFVVIVDNSKLVPKLGKFPLPIEIVRFGSEKTKEAVERLLIELGYKMPRVIFRRAAANKYVTDQQNYILDLYLNEIQDPNSLHQRLLAIVGVVEVGLFINIATKIIIGNNDGSCSVI
jgi:ribose 5-phosphate isomerase A